MKTVHVYSNGSPIHSKVISHLLERSTADENVVINSRGMRFTAPRPVTEFSCPDEEYLLGRRWVGKVFDHIERAHGRDVVIHLFINHTSYLLPKIHHAMRMGPYSYIEDGTGTYATLIDARRGTRLFAAALAADVSSPKDLRGLARFRARVAQPLRRLGRAMAIATFHRWRWLSVNLFALSVRQELNYFDFRDPAYAGIYLTTPTFPELKGIHVPLDVVPPARRRPDTFLVLLPPRKLVGDDHFFRFSAALRAMRARHPERIFAYKSHPSDVHDADWTTILADGAPAGEIVHVHSRGETALWAYEDGYAGIVCLDSSATFYARTFLPPSEFECLDLSQEVAGREGFAERVARELRAC
jgi:hypothetical protein